jgi:uncharacterized protein YecA (UPF0149 family)
MTRNFVKEMEMALNGQQPILDQMQQQLKEQKESLKKQHHVAHNVGETGMIMDGVSNSPITDNDKLHKLETEIQNKRLAQITTNRNPIRCETEKIRPNDLCPCGSGKKFKKCCMGNGKYDTKYIRK